MPERLVTSNLQIIEPAQIAVFHQRNNRLKPPSKGLSPVSPGAINFGSPQPIIPSCTASAGEGVAVGAPSDPRGSYPGVLGGRACLHPDTLTSDRHSAPPGRSRAFTQEFTRPVSLVCAEGCVCSPFCVSFCCAVSKFKGWFCPFLAFR